MTTLEATFVELKEQAEALLETSEYKSIVKGEGMMNVLDELENLLPQTKPNTRYPKLRKVELTIIAADDDEAQIIARNMENSFIAQEGLYTLSCGNIESVNDEDLNMFIDEVPEELLEE
jgi:hypothetical protein